MRNYFLKITFCTLLFGLSTQANAQYYPLGVSMNDGYLPNLDEPDKWIFSLNGMYDWQKEKTQTSQTSYQLTHGLLNVFYGGHGFRGGVQIIQDFNRDVKDLSLGLGFAINRPFFLEAGAGYLTRLLSTTSYEGWSYNAQLGYALNWHMHVKYRTRIRFSFMFNYKELNDLEETKVLNFYPLLGFEFET